jgi:hypothetical protein
VEVDHGGMGTPALHRAIVCVDVEGFSDRRRTNPDQLAVRTALYDTLRQALTQSGIPWDGDDCYHEDRGDGVLILISPTVPKSLLAAALPQTLATALRKHNQAATPETRMRLRIALHAGEVHHDAHGVVGTAINFSFRLLDAEPLKRALRESPGTLALIASQWFFEEIIRHDRTSAASYQQVAVAVKETQATAWICRPDHPYPPGDGAAMPSPGIVEPLVSVKTKGSDDAGRMVDSHQLPLPPQLPLDVSAFTGRVAELTIPLPPRYVHGLSLPKNWADRSTEMLELDRLLQLPTTRVLNLFALGGTGKSTIMRRLVEHCAEPESAFDSLLWFSFYRDEDVERFFLEACRYLIPDFHPSEYPSTFERASLVQSALQSRSTLIVLDGFERITESSGGPIGFIRIARREITSFLNYILSSISGSKVAITSRVDLDELGDQAGYVGYELADLRAEPARVFLERGGLRGSRFTLDRLAGAYGCHALTLSVLVDYLLRRGLATDLEQVDAPLDFPTDTPRAERLHRLLDQYYLHITAMEIEILSWISASPRGLSRRQLRAVESMPDPTHDGQGYEQTASVLARLRRSALVARHDDSGGSKPSLFDSHALLRAISTIDCRQLNGPLFTPHCSWWLKRRMFPPCPRPS